VFTGGASVITGNFPDAVLDAIAAASANAWLSLNTNDFSDVWPASDYRPLFGAGASDPATIPKAWGGFAWDDDNHRLILWGGGHANSNCNEVYIWDAFTQEWLLAFYPTDVQTVIGGMGIEPLDWPSTPQSSHTYATHLWLTVLQRFMNWGGAANVSGNWFRFRDTGSGERPCGPFLLDMSQAGTGKIAGVTGNNVHRGTTVGINLTGAQAWTARDWFLDHPDPNGALPLWGGSKNTVADVRVEGGKDVVYYACQTGALMQIVLNDLNYLNDTITPVGHSSILEAPCGGGLDTVNNIFIKFIGDSTNLLDGWDLDTGGAAFTVVHAGVSGADSAEFLSQMQNEAGAAAGCRMGCTFDRRRGYYVLWSRGGRVWALQAPASSFSTGWTVTKLHDDTTAPRPETMSEYGDTANSHTDAGVVGKWKYADTLDVYIGLQGNTLGKIWAFKPSSWVDPR
jgi:hypothetical protein